MLTEVHCTKSSQKYINRLFQFYSRVHLGLSGKKVTNFSHHLNAILFWHLEVK